MIKEFFGTGDSAIRPDKPMTDREVVIVLTEHPIEKKCLCVNNKKFGWIDFVMGGNRKRRNDSRGCKERGFRRNGL